MCRPSAIPDRATSSDLWQIEATSFPGVVDASQKGKHFVILRENHRALCATGNQHAGIGDRIRIADRLVDVKQTDPRKYE
jgi:hypothetical protein